MPKISPNKGNKNENIYKAPLLHACVDSQAIPVLVAQNSTLAPLRTGGPSNHVAQKGAVLWRTGLPDMFLFGNGIHKVSPATIIRGIVGSKGFQAA
jgi:hypothetical protein